MRVILGPFSCNPDKDSAIVDAFEHLPKGVSKSELFRLAMHHWLKTGGQVPADLEPSAMLAAIDSKVSKLAEQVQTLTTSVIAGGGGLAYVPPLEPEDDPRLKQAEAALDRLADL